MQHNAEPEACDLLMEVNRLDKIVDYVDETNYVRVVLYLVRFFVSAFTRSYQVY